MAQLNREASSDENVLEFVRPGNPDRGINALKLVYQAAEVFGDIQDQARETEARAKALCESAAERLKLANERAEIAERERSDIIAQAGAKLQEASRALELAQSRITAAEEQASAAEQRALAAVTEAHDAKQTLALVEDAIRRQLLCIRPDANGVSAVA